MLLVLLSLFWFWMDSISAREQAIRIGQELAQRCQLQLLDETVACYKIRLGRNRKGHAELLRYYEFEASATGQQRMQCHLELLGRSLQSWHIPPYLQPVN